MGVWRLPKYKGGKMQRTVWKGELSYGIGTTPISLFVATSEHKIRYLERTNHNRLSMPVFRRIVP